MAYNLSGLQTIVSNMAIGNEEAILYGLKHKGALIRVNGIVNAVKYQCVNDEVYKLIYQLKDDMNLVEGYSVSQFAIAALHVLKIETYTGGDEQINDLIEYEFEF